MAKRNIEAVYPLTPMQQGMVFHSLYAPESGVYCEILTCLLRGRLNLTAFKQAWAKIIERHAVLRTSFVWKKLDRILQVVQKDLPLPITVLDWRDLSSDEQEIQFNGLVREERKKGFDLSKAPLFRIFVIQVGEDLHQFILVNHHAILDGWSLPILLRELMTLYEAFTKEMDISLPPTRDFKDYIAWLQQQDKGKARAFWSQKLAGYDTPTYLSGLPGKSISDGEQKYEERSIRLSKEVTNGLNLIARQSYLTINTILLGAWSLLLSKYTGEQNVIFGATTSGRPVDLIRVENMVGLFINTLPIAFHIDDDHLVTEWLKELQTDLAEIRQYEYCPLFEIQEWSQLPKGSPFFDNIFIFENYPIDDTFKNQQLSLRLERFRSFEQTNYPITVISGPGDELPLKISFNVDLIEPQYVERILEHFKNILGCFAMNPQIKIREVSFIDNAEKQLLLEQWNQTQHDFGFRGSIHQLFEKQVTQNPTSIALISNGKSISYLELNEKVNQFARYLQKQNVNIEDLVGLCVPRSIELMIGLLGIIKSGGAYVPLDPNYPEDRLKYMINDANIRVLVTTSSLETKFSYFHGRIISIDREWELIGSESKENLGEYTNPDNLVYLIYTSGSTGKPKGVMVEHHSLVNLAQSQSQTYQLSKKDRILQFVSLSFDAAGEEIYPALISGAGLVLPPPEVDLSAQTILNLCRQNDVTILHFPVAYWHELVQEMMKDQLTLPASIRITIVGGESPNPERFLQWQEINRRSGTFNNTLFFNTYGPTETTISATNFILTYEDFYFTHSKKIPIGKPLANVRVYVLDKHLLPVPIGVPGELFIGGEGVARGYLNQPLLTKERFIDDPFTFGHKLYRSGDLVRYLPDGNLEFIGRIDNQVKVRGYRIELEEIEAVLLIHPEIETCSVITRMTSSGNQLVAYVVVKDNALITQQGLREFLKNRLPDFMVPSIFVFVPVIPLTPTGKVDRRALPEPVWESKEGEYEQLPRSVYEEMLINIWEDVLGVQKIGIKDNFFELGGHSLIATQVVSRIREAFQVEIPLREFFEKPTIEELSEKIQDRRETSLFQGTVNITKVQRGEDLPLSFAQQRLWFLDQLSPDNVFYNIPSAIRLTGELDYTVLKWTIEKLIQRHESLRTIFPTKNGTPVQVILEDFSFDFPLVDLSEYNEVDREKKAIEIIKKEAGKPFNLARGPLIRGFLIRLDQNLHIAVITMHHIITDGWSMGIFVKELATIYELASEIGKDQIEEIPLPALPLQYADYAIWQRNWLKGEVLEKQLDYWKEQLAGRPNMLDLPTDHPRPAMLTSKGKTIPFALSKDLSEGLIKFSKTNNVTLFMTLLSAFQILLNRYSGQEDILVGSPIANRNHVETEGVIGFFVNTLVFRAQFTDDLTFREFVKRTRNISLDAYAHQDLPFEVLVETIQPERNLSHTPIFQVAFALQNISINPFELENLIIEPIEIQGETAKFDMTLVMAELDECIKGTVEFNTDLFEPDTIYRMVDHLRTILEAVVSEPETSIFQLPLLTKEERQTMLVDWNSTELRTPMDKCAHELFEYHAEQHPDAIALKFEDKTLTYQELNQLSNRLANYLRKIKVGPDTIVGISTERSMDMIIGILGTMKAGGAYLPLDPNYPVERLAFMLQDSNIQVLLSQKPLQSKLPPTQAQIIWLDEDWQRIALESDIKPNSGVKPNNLAYVIYTSGSTGKPKGTLLNHKGLSNLIEVQRINFKIHQKSRILQFSPFSFDASIWETFMALGNGATLCLVKQEVISSINDLARAIKKIGITNMTLPPSVLRVLPDEDLPSLETVIAAGEACTLDLVQKWSVGRDFFNAYGPTETTVCASMYLCNSSETVAPPIGKPIGNTKLYILDKYLQPVPIGVPGELHVSGVSLARGYLNRKEMTMEKFIPSPFIPNERLYKTGDLVRYRRDGNIEFLGRIDQQVKIRGFRIELGEIESTISSHPDVREAVVVVKDDKQGEKRLVGYIIAHPQRNTNANDLRLYMRKTLPEYMVPSIFVFVDAFPLSPSGKVDRKALPEPETTRTGFGTEYVAPRNERESILANICSELLGVQQVGVFDNFFELGGHSLLATQFISRIRENFHVEVPLRSLFENPTIDNLSQQIENLLEKSESDEERIARLLAKIDQLSDDEIKALLAEKRALLTRRQGNE